MTELEDTIKVVNCAACGAELLGESMRAELKARKKTVEIYCLAEFGRVLRCLAGRIRGRPYCQGCLSGGEFIKRKARD